MPVPGFLTSIADRAQSALQASPLASHLPQSSGSPDNSSQPSANQAAGHGGTRNIAFESIQHQLRAFGQHYGTTSPSQRCLTAAKGVVLDVDSLSRDMKAHSKELYTWGQNPQETANEDDIRDVSDRLAYFNFVSGTLSSTLATRLDAARSPFKALRDAETALAPRRTVRSNLQQQINKAQLDQKRGYEKHINELTDQLRKAELDDTSSEREIELLKRKALRESERQKWQAIREYAEKLVLISQAADLVIDALPTLPPQGQSPYTGSDTTGAARASLQRALDNYKTGSTSLNPHPAGASLSRSDTMSFGETHAHELSAISTDLNQPGVPMTPPVSNRPSVSSPAYPQPIVPPQNSPPPINPTSLNNSPAPIPTAIPQPHESSITSPLPAGSPPDSSSKMPGITPTVAETGVPVSGGPGPASGSLHNVRAASNDAGPRSEGQPGNEPASLSFGQTGALAAAAPAFESAEDEKKRLAREDRERILATGGTVPGEKSAQPRHETAQEEKERLAREDRERILAGNSTTDNSKRDGDELPPYQEM